MRRSYRSERYLGIKQIERGVDPRERGPGEFTSFVAALLLMYGPIKKLSRVNANLQQAAAASERIFELLDTHSEVSERPGAPARQEGLRGMLIRAVSKIPDPGLKWLLKIFSPHFLILFMMNGWVIRIVRIPSLRNYPF